MEIQFQPGTFADKIIQLESALQYQGSLALIWTLNDLYRAGIDHYIQKQPKKAKFIQNKMTSLLANPDNLRILQRQTNKKNHRNISNQQNQNQVKDCSGDKIRDYHIRLNTSKLNQELNKFHTVADSCIKNIVQTSERAVTKISKLKTLDINKQQSKLEDRIALKRVKSQQKMKRVLSQRNLFSQPPGLICDQKLKELIEGGQSQNFRSA